MKRNSAGTAIGLGIVLLVIGFAIYEMRTAQKYAQQVLVDDLTAKSVALRDEQLDLSLLLSVEAFQRMDNPRTRGVLLDNVQAHPQLIRYLHHDTGTATALAFSPDGKTIAVGYSGGVIVLSDVATGARTGEFVTEWEPPKEYKGEPLGLGPVAHVTFSPDGKTLIASVYTRFGDQRVTSLWNVATGSPISEPLLEKKSPDDLLWSPDGKTLAIPEWGKVSFWDWETHKIMGEFPIKPFEGLGGLNAPPILYSPVFSLDGKTFAAVSSVNTITFWDTATFQPVGAALVVGEPYAESRVYQIAFDRDGKALLAVSDDGTLTSWDLKTRRSIRQWQFRQGKEDYGLFGYAVTFNSDASVVALNHAGFIHVLDTQSGQPISVPLEGNKNNLGAVVFSPDGHRLASIAGRGVILWDLESRNPLQQVIADYGGSSVAFSPDGKWLAADTFFSDSGWGPSVGIWDVRTHKLIGRLGKADSIASRPVAFHPNGKTIAAGSNTGVILWDVESLDAIDQLPLESNGYLYDLAFSPDGRRLAIAHEAVITLWDLESRQGMSETLQAGDGTVEGIAFSPDGKWLAAGDAFRSLLLWDLQARDFVKWTGSSNVVDDVAFSPDGRTLASTDRDGKLILWDVKSQKALGDPFFLPPYSIPVTLDFRFDGSVLASGSYDNTIMLWDVATRQPLGSGLLANEWPVNQVMFSPDGNTLATISNRLLLWDVDPHSWVEIICQRAGRNFTRAEWSQYFPEQPYHAPCSQWPWAVESTPTPAATP